MMLESVHVQKYEEQNTQCRHVVCINVWNYLFTLRTRNKVEFTNGETIPTNTKNETEREKK